MSPDKQRIAIAEACGKLQKPQQKPTIEELEKILQGQDKLIVTLLPNGEVFALPDYLNDLNAMHEAERVLDARQADMYARRILVTATAAQRAEAFLRTTNKWSDE